MSGPEGRVTAEPESGTTLMVSATLGSGPWRVVPSPFVIDPTGGYGPKEVACPGYSSPLLASVDPRESSVFMLAGTATASGKCAVRYGAVKLGTGK